MLRMLAEISCSAVKPRIIERLLTMASVVITSMKNVILWLTMTCLGTWTVSRVVPRQATSQRLHRACRRQDIVEAATSSLSPYRRAQGRPRPPVEPRRDNAHGCPLSLPQSPRPRLPPLDRAILLGTRRGDPDSVTGGLHRHSCVGGNSVSSGAAHNTRHSPRRRESSPRHPPPTTR